MKLDQTSDFSNVRLYQLVKAAEVKDYVKEAELDTPESLSTLDSTSFADSVSRSFPINTPARVYISNMFLQDKRASLDKKYGKSYADTVEGIIMKTAEALGIKEDLVNFNSSFNVKQAADYETSVIVLDDINPMTQEVEKIELFPVKTAGEFVKAAEIFVNNIGNYPFDWRRQIASGFVEKAALFNVDELPDLICKYASLFFPAAKEDMVKEFTRRSYKLASSEAKDIVEQLKQVVTNYETNEDIFKAAELLETLEIRAGLYDNTKTAALLPDLVDRLFTVSIEKMAEDTDVVTMAGQTFKMADLQGVDAAIYKEAFGLDINPADVNKMREVLPTLPLSDVALFKEISSVSPI